MSETYKIDRCCNSGIEEKVRSEILFHKIACAIRYDEQNARIILDNGKILDFCGNEGCGGCSNGWFYLEKFLDKIPNNAITNVKLCCADEEYGSSRYEIFIFCDNEELNLVSYAGHDNGWYGEGFSIIVSECEND